MLSLRLKQARLAAGLTLDGLSALLGDAGRPLTKAALSKFENDKARPTAGSLLAIARAVGVSADSLMREPELQLTWIAFRKQASLTKSAQERAQAAAWMQAERHLWLVDALHSGDEVEIPPRRQIRRAEEAETAAEDLRMAWGLGTGPIESLTQAAEDHGVIVVEVQLAEDGFHGLSGIANDRHPVIVTSAGTPADRRRFNLGHELGHVLLEGVGLSEKTEESIAHRFAGAVLAPADTVRRELGHRRRHLDLRELAYLKQKYGLSMQAWARRASDVGVIDDNEYRRVCIEFSRRGWRKTEPCAFEGPERPMRARMLALRALSEGIVTPARAEELCPGVTRELEARPTRRTARELLAMSAAGREDALREAADNALPDYAAGRALRDFDAVDAPREDTP